MSFVTKEIKGQETLGGLVVLPEQAEFSDIPQLQKLNRGQNEPKENLDELFAEIKSVQKIVTPLKGYLENKRLKVTNGSRRLAVTQALQAEGITIPLPVVLINKPTTDEEIAEAIADSLIDNNFREPDSPTSLHSSFKTLRDMDYSYQDIGDATGFSHQKVYNILKAFEIKPLKDAIVKGEISDRAASTFFTEAYKKIDPKTKKPTFNVVLNDEGKKVKEYIYDEEKISKALKDAKTTANEKGKGKVTTNIVRQSSATKSVALGLSAIGIILDEPQDNVPAMFRMMFRCIAGRGDDALSLDSFKKMAKKNGFYDEIEWFFDIEFDKDKRKAAKDSAKAAKEKAKVDKAKSDKKANPAVSDNDDLDAEDYE
jgi:hypothetical protein